MKPKIHYIDNKAFYDAIVEHRKQVIAAKKKGIEPPRITNYIGECISKIANKLSTMPKFINYSYRDEMVHDGIENCFLYYHDYDPYKTDPNTGLVIANPFAYFTQISFFAFIRRINKEERIRYSVYKSFYFTVIHGNVSSEYDMRMLFDDGEKSLMTPTIYDNISLSIEKYEQKEAKKKLEREKKKKGLQKFFEED